MSWDRSNPLFGSIFGGLGSVFGQQAAGQFRAGMQQDVLDAMARARDCKAGQHRWTEALRNGRYVTERCDCGATQEVIEAEPVALLAGPEDVEPAPPSTDDPAPKR